MCEVRRTRAARRRSASNPAADEDEDDDEDDDDDDHDEPVWTFRVAIIGLMSFLFLLILNRYVLTQVGECIMVMIIASVVIYPVGWIVALFTPRRTVYYPWLGFEFLVNAGPFGLGEYALISLIGNFGAVIGVLTSNSVDLTTTV